MYVFKRIIPVLLLGLVGRSAYNGNIVNVGAPSPSPTDVKGARSTPDVVLGYTQDVIRPSSNTIGGTTTVETKMSMGFYNSGGKIISVKYDDFKNAVRRISK